MCMRVCCDLCAMRACVIMHIKCACKPHHLRSRQHNASVCTSAHPRVCSVVYACLCVCVCAPRHSALDGRAHTRIELIFAAAESPRAPLINYSGNRTWPNISMCGGRAPAHWIHSGSRGFCCVCVCACAFCFPVCVLYF